MLRNICLRLNYICVVQYARNKFLEEYLTFELDFLFTQQIFINLINYLCVVSLIVKIEFQQSRNW